MDIAVLAMGATNFDVPAPACFPNLPDSETGLPLAPGAKSALWSFNHDIGRWHVVGSMTVSDDGLLVVSDPGTGILATGEEAAIVADRAIAEKLANDYWDKPQSMIADAIKDNRFADGIIAAIEEVGAQLAPHFPRADDDVNELPDEISYSL